jgi:hypothetical protein
MDDALAADLNQITGFPPDQMARFLSVVALELTISGRETYVPGSMEVGDSVRLRALNESQHFIVGILRRVLFSEEVDITSLVSTLRSLFSDKHVGEALQSASRRAIRQLRAFHMLQ